jgi:uncharacterized phage protein (TIGR01671 family)
MREIKFRAMDKRTKIMKMTYDVTLYANGWIKCVFNDGYECEYSPDVAREVLPIMQYTGLKDKNGKEIYESDIVKDEFNEIFEIKYLVDFASFGMEEIGNRKYINFLGRIFTEDKDYYHWEVIGNIHENPDFLEQKT